ncbi:hypothetical protein [Paenarthrobacter nitroguajacolicus]|uniref:hypothetical protein n=1 Tax=Paenarthrobacter nitroguajacolicus TaxID=211146 RepID=UPI00405423D1
MPYQGDTTPAASTLKAGTPKTATLATTIVVIPAVDLFVGTVTITSDTRARAFGHPEPWLIAQALAQAVRPTRWCEASRTLTVTVAAVGQRRGAQQHYELTGDDPA